MSTPSKTNYFGSKVVPTESNQISEKKGPIWQFFSQSNIEKNKAICKLCGGALSLGSDKPKNQTITGLKIHLKSKHQNEFSKFTQILEDVKLSKEKRKRETLAKFPLFLRIFVLSVSVSVFGLRPDVFPVSVSVSA